MPRAQRVDLDGKPHSVKFECPGCGMPHVLYTQDTPAERVGPRWTFNRDYDKPTFTPSILARGAVGEDGESWLPNAICHSFVTNGEIQFLGDCTHALAGQTVPLPDKEV